MNELSSKQYYNIFLILTTLIYSTTTYQMLTVTDPKLCSPITKRKIQLGSDSASGLIVSLGRLSDHSLDWNTNYLCKFQVDTTKSNNGLFIVIQNLVFRKNETTQECIDYVQYKRQDGALSKKYCGSLHSALGMDPIFAPDVYVSDLTPTINSFDEPTGKVDVHIYVSKQPLHTYEEMELNIVFTSYRDCFKAKKTDQKCSSKHLIHCIYKDFIRDGYVNCPYPGCVDEDGCADKVHEREEKQSSVGNKVIIGSVSLVLVLFIFFICVIWLCRKYKKLCWAEEFSNSSPANNQGRTIELSDQFSRIIPMPSTAVASGLGAGSTDEDKDLPPSYDSLFPNR